jgi:hypothetical protein
MPRTRVSASATLGLTSNTSCDLDAAERFYAWLSFVSVEEKAHQGAQPDGASTSRGLPGLSAAVTLHSPQSGIILLGRVVFWPD